jgi:hypothetical protein
MYVLIGNSESEGYANSAPENRYKCKLATIIQFTKQFLRGSFMVKMVR